MMDTLVDIFKAWTMICLVVAVLSITAFPILYSFSTWNATKLGRLFMFLTISFAVILDSSLLLRYWKPPDPLLASGINAVRYSLVAVSTVALTGAMLRMNYKHRKGNKHAEVDSL